VATVVAATSIRRDPGRNLLRFFRHCSCSRAPEMIRRALAVLALVLASCDPTPDSSVMQDELRPTGKGDGAAPVSAIAFDGAFAPPVPTPALIAGGRVAIEYDAQRFWDVFDGSESLGWFASTYHCYGYGCCEARFPEVQAHHRFDDGEVVSRTIEDGATSFELPADTSTLEMWFSAPGFELRTWYCGCDAACAQQNRDAAQFHWVDREGWDSRFGENYTFEVGGWPVVHGEDVKLVEARTIDGVFTGEIEVSDIAWQKDVQVHWSLLGRDDTQWVTSDAAFAGMSEGGDFERWSFTIEDGAIGEGELRFAIRYAVDGRTRWDDNCGWDYQLLGTAAVSGDACD
jgi:hypothetical protein